ncbi:lysine transporter LysE [Streptomyces sp. TR06-5]|uniref:lysine transporter LysE n=1 Tax=Streptomyces sp. TR06-5 TaxID=3385976 RepID=UPI0039A15885
MTVSAERGRVHRALRRIGSFLRELVGEAAAELVLTVLACIILSGLVLAFALGRRLNPLATGGAAGAVLVFLGYGGWELLRPTKPVRRGRLAVVAGAMFSVAVVVVLYASNCGCST